jgi:hypothetical protein
MLCFYGDDYEECRLLAFRNQIRTSKETLRLRYRTQRLMLCKIIVFMAVTMKNAAYWDMTQCSSYKNRRFGGMYRHNHQGETNQRARNNISGPHGVRPQNTAFLTSTCLNMFFWAGFLDQLVIKHLIQVFVTFSTSNSQQRRRVYTGF